MAYFLMNVSASYVGTNGNYKFQAETQEEADKIAHDKAVEHVESFEDVNEWEQENGSEYEYNYSVKEVSDQEYFETNYDEIN